MTCSSDTEPPSKSRTAPDADMKSSLPRSARQDGTVETGRTMSLGELLASSAQSFDKLGPGCQCRLHCRSHIIDVVENAGSKQRAQRQVTTDRRVAGRWAAAPPLVGCNVFCPKSFLLDSFSLTCFVACLLLKPALYRFRSVLVIATPATRLLL